MDTLVTDYNRITLRPLTKEDAAAMGHVVWLESNDIKDALRTMFYAAAYAPVNCVVWANAGDMIPEFDRQTLTDWRKAFIIDYRAYENSPMHTPAQARRILNDEFNKASFLGRTLPEWDQEFYERGLRVLERHTTDMAVSVLETLKPRPLRVNVRANTKHTTEWPCAVHTDGNGFADTRFLQALGSPVTCILDNKDAVPRDGYFNSFRPRPDGPLTFWQPPENSMILITNTSLAWQPILHTTPPTPPGSKPVSRTLLVYDLAYR